MHRVLIIVSCSLAFWRYDDGTTSRLRNWNLCGDQAAYAEVVRRQHVQAWKEQLRRALRPRPPRPLVTTVPPPPTWARDYGGRTGWKR